MCPSKQLVGVTCTQGWLNSHQRDNQQKLNEHSSPAPEIMMRSSTEDTTLSTEMIDSCCSGDIGRSGAAFAASSASSIKLIEGGAVDAESPRCDVVCRAALVCRAILDPHPLVSERAKSTRGSRGIQGGRCTVHVCRVV